MKRKLLMALLMLFTLGVTAQESVYGFKAKDSEGREVSLDQYQGKVLLIVNTATKCGFTPQYKELETLYEKYRGEGLEILDFPCNQFGGQAPGGMAEIRQFCTSNFDTQFPQFEKVEVNGPDELPLFAYLKQQQGFVGFGSGVKSKFMDGMLRKQDPDYAAKSDIKWNFTKFLVDRKGCVVARFEPTHDMAEVDKAVARLLKKQDGR